MGLLCQLACCLAPAGTHVAAGLERPRSSLHLILHACPPKVLALLCIDIQAAEGQVRGTAATLHSHSQLGGRNSHPSLRCLALPATAGQPEAAGGRSPCAALASNALTLSPHSREQGPFTTIQRLFSDSAIVLPAEDPSPFSKSLFERLGARLPLAALAEAWLVERVLYSRPGPRVLPTRVDCWRVPARLMARVPLRLIARVLLRLTDRRFLLLFFSLGSGKRAGRGLRGFCGGFEGILQGFAGMEAHGAWGGGRLGCTPATAGCTMWVLWAEPGTCGLASLAAHWCIPLSCRWHSQRSLPGSLPGPTLAQSLAHRVGSATSGTKSAIAPHSMPNTLSDAKFLISSQAVS